MKVSNPHDERRSNLPLKQTLSRHWFRFRRELFPWLEESLGPLGERYQRLVRVLELVRVEEWLPYNRGWRGRPLEDRAALARAFLAKAVLDVPTGFGKPGVISRNLMTALWKWMRPTLAGRKPTSMPARS